MEKERASVQKKRLSGMKKAKQFYLLMDFRNAIKNYSKFLTADQKPAIAAEARFYKGRSHEELGEIEEAMMEYRVVIKRDPIRVWVRQANRHMLMLGEFYGQKKTVSEEAKRQLEAYRDQMFIQNVEKYTSMVSKSSLKRELVQQGTLSAAEVKELKRRRYLADNPFRRPSVLKERIDANSRELRYLYNKRLRSGIAGCSWRLKSSRTAESAVSGYCSRTWGILNLNSRFQTDRRLEIQSRPRFLR